MALWSKMGWSWVQVPLTLSMIHNTQAHGFPKVVNVYNQFDLWLQNNMKKLKYCLKWLLFCHRLGNRQSKSPLTPLPQGDGNRYTVTLLDN